MTTKKIIDISVTATLDKILGIYCDEVDAVPTQETKAFFREWERHVPAKLIRQCIYAGIFWAYTRPETIYIDENYVPD